LIGATDRVVGQLRVIFYEPGVEVAGLELRRLQNFQMIGDGGLDAKHADVAQGAAFVVWLTLILFLDLIMLGILIRESLTAEAAVAIALTNPLQVFRTAAMMLFDPQLVLLGQSAYVILDNFGKMGYILWALFYPVGLGTICAWFGYVIFKRSDLP